MSRDTQHFEPTLQRPDVVKYASQYSAIRSATQTPGHDPSLVDGSLSLDGLVFSVVVVRCVVVVVRCVVVGRGVVWVAADVLAGPFSTQHLILGEGQGISSSTS